MRAALLAAALAASAPAAAQTAPTVEAPSGPPAPSDKAAMAEEKAMGAMGVHADRLYSFTLAEVEYTRFRGTDAVEWDAQGWIGGDHNKFWWKSEGETKGPRFEQAEVQALYSRNLWTYFDLQGGVRYDFEPDSRGYAVVALQGLSPYMFETEASLFVGFKGDVLMRFRQELDILLTNRLIVQPRIETDLYLTDVPERLIGSGFSVVEAGIQTRYEFSRKFAPYVAAVYEKRVGKSARLARAAGEDTGGWTLRGGVRVWF